MTSTAALLLVVLIVLSFASPLLVYLAAKLWAFGSMRGRQAYREWRDKQQNSRPEGPDGCTM